MTVELVNLVTMGFVGLQWVINEPDDTASATDVHEILVPHAKSRQLPARYFAILL